MSRHLARLVVWYGLLIAASNPGALAAGIGRAREIGTGALTRVVMDANRPASLPTRIQPLGMVTLLALATFASEDLACIAAGMLVAHGRLAFATATTGCAVGIFAGDLGLFFAGKIVGRPMVRRWPLRALVSEASLDACAAWLRARGPQVIVASRFLPGMRLPTYVAAGVLGLDARTFARWFALASAFWTSSLVGAATVATAWAGVALGPPSTGTSVLLAALLLGVLQAGRTLATHGGRRKLLSRWRRITRWEFWPPWVFYPPIVAWIAWLMVRHRSATVFTAANPGIPAAGFVGESKSDILRALTDGGAPVAAFTVLRSGTAPAVRAREARSFAATHGLPLVLKPDLGQRGSGVRILRSADAVSAAVRTLGADAILQVYVPGIEFGLFYARRPGDERGHVISVTEKQLPAVVGDGRRTVRELILDDRRAIAMWRVYHAMNRATLNIVPRPGATVRIAELGSHCRGAVFLDGDRWLTPALEDAVERAARAMPGFSFGRFDVRAASIDDLQAGRFTILELNGVTSEPTHIYDPSRTLFSAYRTVAGCWALAFEIGAAHAAHGARVWSVGELVAVARRYRRVSRNARLHDTETGSDTPGTRDVAPSHGHRRPAFLVRCDGGARARELTTDNAANSGIRSSW